MKGTTILKLTIAMTAIVAITLLTANALNLAYGETAFFAGIAAIGTIATYVLKQARSKKAGD